MSDGHAEVVALILGAGELLTGGQRLVELLAVPGADDLELGVRVEAARSARGKVLDRAGRRLPDEEVAGLARARRRARRGRPRRPATSGSGSCAGR